MVSWWGSVVRGWTSGGRVLVPERLGELGATAGDPRLHGAERDRQHLGDLGVVEVGDVAQHDGSAELLGQVVEGVVDGHPQSGRLDAPLGERVDDLGPRLVVGDDVRRRPPAAAAQLVEGGVGGDAVDPRGERRAPVEAGEAADDADHRLLGGVVGVAAGAGDAPAHGVDAVVVAAQQPVEGVAIAGLGCRHQRGVVRSSRINRSGSHRWTCGAGWPPCTPGHARARGARSAGGAPVSPR